MEALSIFERERPDLAIVDVRLPALSGFDLVTRLRAQSDLPILMLSASSSDYDKVRGL